MLRRKEAKRFGIQSSGKCVESTDCNQDLKVLRASQLSPRDLPKGTDGGWAGCGLHYYRESPFTNCNQLKMEGIIIVGNCPEQLDHPHSEGKLEIACSVFSVSELTTRKT